MLQDCSIFSSEFNFKFDQTNEKILFDLICKTALGTKNHSKSVLGSWSVLRHTKRMAEFHLGITSGVNFCYYSLPPAALARSYIWGDRTYNIITLPLTLYGNIWKLFNSGGKWQRWKQINKFGRNRIFNLTSLEAKRSHL